MQLDRIINTFFSAFQIYFLNILFSRPNSSYAPLMKEYFARANWE